MLPLLPILRAPAQPEKGRARHSQPCRPRSAARSRPSPASAPCGSLVTRQDPNTGGGAPSTDAIKAGGSVETRRGWGAGRAGRLPVSGSPPLPSQPGQQPLKTHRQRGRGVRSRRPSAIPVPARPHAGHAPGSRPLLSWSLPFGPAPSDLLSCGPGSPWGN